MLKTKSFAALKAEIAELEAQASDARRREVLEVLKDIKDKIAVYGISGADLGFKGATLASPTTRKVQSAGVAKYRDPKSGKTWTGHGRAPDWLAKARSRDAFLVDGVATLAASAVVAPAATVKATKPRDVVGKAVQVLKTAKLVKLAATPVVAKKVVGKKTAAHVASEQVAQAN